MLEKFNFDGDFLVQSCSHRVETGCGNLYVVVDHFEYKVRRVAAQLGKQGSCTRCQNDALAKSITIGLQFGVPIQEYINELKGYQCEKPKPFPKNNRVMSCPDGIAKALEEVAGVLQITG